jgi:hypothetical protein
MWVGMLAAASILAATGCNSGHHAASRGKQSAVPVVYATAITSPDGKRIAVVTHNRTALEVGPASGGHRRTIYRSTPDGIITTDIYWASPYLIAFGADFGVNTIDVRTRRVHTIANGNSFTVSSDGRWIAWSQVGGEAAPDRVGIVSINGGNCRVPRPPNAVGTGAFFKPGVKRLFFLHEHYDPSRGVFGSGRFISVPLSSLRPC